MAQQQIQPLPSETPPPIAELHKVCNLFEIDTVRKGVVTAPQITREEVSQQFNVHDRARQAGAWDPADIPRVCWRLDTYIGSIADENRPSFICQPCQQLPTPAEHGLLNQTTYWYSTDDRLLGM